MFSKEELKYIADASLWNDECSKEELPEWVLSLAEWTDVFPIHSWQPHPLLDGDEDNPPLSLLQNYIEGAFVYMRQQLQRRCPYWRDDFEAGAMISWKSAFRARLQIWCREPLRETLNILLPGESLPEQFSYKSEIPDGIVWDGSLMYEMLKGWPVLARMLTTQIMFETEHMCELIEHIHTDRECISKKLLNGSMPKIAQVSAGDSDVHNGGRSVHCITYTDGQKIIYKPRSQKMDQAWRKFVDQAASLAGMDTFYMPETIDMGTYGYVEFIEEKPVSCDGDYAEFFLRAGFLMGLVYVLRGSDFHAENVIACGAQPVLVDVETVISPFLNGNPISTKKTKTEYDEYNLFVTGFLPYLKNGKGYEADLPSLTTGMPYHCLPYDAVTGVRRDAREFSDYVEQGFVSACDVIINHREQMKISLENFTGVYVRYLIRSTNIYVRQFSIVADSKNLKSGIDFSERIGWLKNLYISRCGTNELSKEMEKNYNIERASMLQADVPCLGMQMDAVGKGIEFLDDDTVKKQCEQIKILLSRHNASHDSDKVFECADDCRDKKNDDVQLMEKYAEDAFDRYGNFFLNNDTFVIVTERRGFNYYLANQNSYFMDCLLGLLPAFCIFAEELGNEHAKELTDIVAKRALYEIEKMPLRLFETGMCEGISGVLWTSAFCGHIISNPVFEELRHKALTSLLEKKERLPGNMTISGFAPLYGLGGVLVAASECKEYKDCPEAFELAQRYANMILDENPWKRNSKNGLDGIDGIAIAFAKALPMLEGHTKQAVRTELEHYIEAIGKEDCEACDEAWRSYATDIVCSRLGLPLPAMQIMGPVQNQSLRFGNAGRLLVQRGREELRSVHIENDELRKGFLSLWKPEKNFVFPGMFYGEGGRLLALAGELKRSIHCEER